MFTSQLSNPDFTDAIANITLGIDYKIKNILEMLGTETIAYLRSLTGQMVAPVRPGEGTRSAHPGGWADVTGNLSNAYGWTVNFTGDGYTLVLFNTMSYAVYLEAREGYFVLHGVTDPGGPVEAALRHALAIIAPDWTIVNIAFQPS